MSLDLLVRGQFFRHAFIADPTLVDDISAIRDGQCKVGVMFGKKDCDIRLQRTDDLADILTIVGVRPSQGSSRSSMRGLPISALARESICCSPPLSAPPLWSLSFCSRGKILVIWNDCNRLKGTDQDAQPERGDDVHDLHAQVGTQQNIQNQEKNWLCASTSDTIYKPLVGIY